MLNFVVLGPPLCGKGTQSGLLAEKLQLCVISPGEIFREAISSDTELGRQVRDIVHSGRLVHNNIVIDAVMPFLTGSRCNGGFVLDGFPRTAGQLEFLDDFSATKNRKISGVILIEIDKEEMVKRSCGRDRVDDRSIDVLETRLRAYRNQTLPVISEYHKRELLIETDGMGTIEEVWERLWTKVQEFLISLNEKPLINELALQKNRDTF